jgi:hypothetical protein
MWADALPHTGRGPGYPKVAMALGGRLSPLVREPEETVYQFDRPYSRDSSAITRELDLEPTPWDEVCRRTAGLEYCRA